MRPSDTPETLQPIRMLAMGDLVDASDFDRLLRVFAGLVYWHPHASLIIVGDGPAREALERRIDQDHLADHVGLPGPIGRGRLVELLQRTNVFVLPVASAAGTLPAVLPMAMSGGLCVVSARSPAIERLIEDGHNGLIVEPGDEASLSRALHLTTSSPGLRERLGNAAAATIHGSGGISRSA
jgi:glycosyltransferase involved in cell wall biosynthesis